MKLKKWKTGVILVNFPYENLHGCDQHCSFCSFYLNNYNIELKPTDEEITTFISNIHDGATIQICGAGDPLFRFEQNKDYLLHVIDLLHQAGFKVEVVTKKLNIVDLYYNTLLNVVDSWSFSIETLDENYLTVISKLLAQDKYVRITKVYNFTNNIHDVNYDSIKNYINFYNFNTSKFSISFRPNYNYEYSFGDWLEEAWKISTLAEDLNRRAFLQIRGPDIEKKQLWNGRYIPCGQTGQYIKKDLGLE